MVRQPRSPPEGGQIWPCAYLHAFISVGPIATRNGSALKNVVGRNVKGHGGECYPALCGTGTEDYFCDSYNFEDKAIKTYREYTMAYTGLPHVVRLDGFYQANTPFSLYRWHIMDPLRFKENLGVTMHYSAGAAIGAICPTRTTWPRPPSGTRQNSTRRSRPCRTATRLRSFETNKVG